MHRPLVAKAPLWHGGEPLQGQCKLIEGSRQRDQEADRGDGDDSMPRALPFMLGLNLPPTLGGSAAQRAALAGAHTLAWSEGSGTPEAEAGIEDTELGVGLGSLGLDSRPEPSAHRMPRA